MKRLIGLLVGLVISATGAEAVSLDFVLENQTFARNLEWTGLENLKGQTFIGNIAKPYFTYKVQDNITIDVGAVLNMPFGDDNRVSATDPLITLHYNFAPGWRINAGTLSWRHPLLNSIYSEFQEYLRPVGQGFQIEANTKHIRQDTWIDWEQRESSNRKEMFAIGNYSQLKYAGFMADGQVMWNHSGGQLNSNSGGGVVNNHAYAIGAGYSIYPKKQNKKLYYFEELGVDFHYVGLKDTPRSDTPGVTENGTSSRVFARIWDADLHFMHWNGGSNFRTTKGNLLYQVGKDFQEVGVEKTWWLADSVSLTGGVKTQYIEKTFQHVDLIEVKWWLDLPLFPDYFKKLTEDESSKPAGGRKLIKKFS